MISFNIIRVVAFPLSITKDIVSATYETTQFTKYSVKKEKKKEMRKMLNPHICNLQYRKRDWRMNEDTLLPRKNENNEC